MTWRVVVGTLLVVATIIIVAFTAINEPARMAGFEEGFTGRSIEAGAALFQSNCTPCHGIQGQGIPGVAPALNTPALFDGTRLQQVGWSGTLEDFLQLTIAGGRPLASTGTTYPQRMPTWSQDYGGPLRPDQVNNLVDFVMNWDTAAEGAAVAEEPGTAAPPAESVGTNLTDPPLPDGDVANGQALTESLGCIGCHVTATVGPAWMADSHPSGAGIGARAAEIISIAEYAGEATNAAEYLRESIVSPSAYIVEGFPDGVMPAIYADSLSIQDAADIVAYLETLK
ncbi:MAG: c-type cytochrome [Anaerolineales bacterium]